MFNWKPGWDVRRAIDMHVNVKIDEAALRGINSGRSSVEFKGKEQAEGERLKAQFGQE